MPLDDASFPIDLASPVAHVVSALETEVAAELPRQIEANPEVVAAPTDIAFDR